MIDLLTKLRMLKRRAIGIGAGAGAGWAIAGAVMLLILFMWIDLALELPPGMRVLASVAAGICAVVLFAQLAALAVRRSRPMELAKRLDESAAARGQVVSGIDLMLARGWEATEKNVCPAQSPSPCPLPGVPGRGEERDTLKRELRTTVTAGMAQMAVARAAEIARATPAGAVAPPRPLYAPGACVMAIAVGLGLLATFAPRLTMTQWRRFADPFGDHPPYSRLIITVEPGDASVVYGSAIDIRAKAEGEPVDRVELVLQSEQQSAETIPMFQQPDGAWRATISNVTAPAKYTVRAHRARTQQYSISVITVPKIEAVKFRVTPPAYAHRPPYEGPLPQGGLAGLPGTRVDVWARSNRPLSSGIITGISGGPTTQPAASITLKTGADSTEVTGGFSIQRNEKGELRVIDTNGQPSRDVVSIPVTLLADQRPFIRILQPMQTSLATPDTELPVWIDAEDDYGIKRVQLFRSLNDSRAMAMDLSVPPQNPTRLPLRSALMLKDYGVKPGDVIKLYARVEDTDPAGPKGAESQIVTVQIISQEEFQQMLVAQQGIESLMSKYDQAKRRIDKILEEIDKLQKELKKQDPNSEVSKELKEKIGKLGEQMEREAKEMEEAAKQEIPLDVDKELTKQLERLAESVKAAAGDAKWLSKQQGLGSGVADKEMQKIRERLEEKEKEYEEAVIKPLEQLEKVYPLIEDATRFVLLYERQRDLEQRLASLKDKDQADEPGVKARVRDFESEQKALKEELNKLMDDIDAHIKLLPVDDDTPKPAQLKPETRPSGSTLALSLGGLLMGAVDGGDAGPTPEQEKYKEEIRKLKYTAERFVEALRASGAGEKMAEAELMLGELRPTPGHAAAKEAADILEKFIGRCKGMGDEGEFCLRFAPKLSSCIGNTIKQLAAARIGSGSGGYGMTGQGNIGLYGRLPVNANRSGGGQRDGRPGVATQSPEGKGDQPDDRMPNRGMTSRGQSGASVPMQYKKRVDEYFERVADELGEK